MFNILIVEDEKKIRDLLEIYFIKENYTVDKAENGEEALLKMQLNNYDIILLDLYMPKMDGFDTCREIRKTSSVPIVILTALSDDESQLLAYELGADDFIMKPFKKDILLAKVNRIMERTKINMEQYTFKNLIIEKDSYRVFLDNKEIKFAPKEFEVLLYLAENIGMIKTREDILNKVWNYDLEVNDRVVDNHIKKIRKKLGNCSNYVKTVVSVGYKFEV
ncbi:MAG: response regulator transcription factor [Sebaldella sp.]|nr:response regulator transcription factor [Sebaldella sp.]